MTERKIVIGLIVSTRYLQSLHSVWKSKYLQSGAAKLIAGWCWEYFNKYHKAPLKSIEDIYFQKLKEGLNKDIAKEIEQDILPSLSEQYLTEGIDFDYLYDITIKHFREVNLREHADKINVILDSSQRGNIDEKLKNAEKLVLDFPLVNNQDETTLKLKDKDSLRAVTRAFNTSNESVIYYPGALGKFWNDQLVRGGFITLMSTEKRGKTFWLLDMAVRASRQGRNVAFFQAGDMTQNQQLRRLSIYLTRNSDREKYCGKMFEPVKDCIWNQLDLCDKPERTCTFGVFDNRPEDYRDKLTFDELKEAYTEFPDYTPCYQCAEYEQKHWGIPWMKQVEVKEPLTAKRARKACREFFVDKKDFRFSTHPNRTLSVPMVRNILLKWNKEDGFKPDFIVADYGDIMIAPGAKDNRQAQNIIWQQLRGLSQEFDCLTATGTQSDADSYKRDRLGLGNFSEDKRKYAHVTAMYGLNRDKHDREKRLKVMRINELAVREDDYSVNNEVYILQNLQRGRPFLDSYF